MKKPQIYLQAATYAKLRAYQAALLERGVKKGLGLLIAEYLRLPEPEARRG